MSSIEVQLRQVPRAWDRETSPAMMDLTRSFLEAGYVATVEQPEFGDSLMHGDVFDLGQVGPIADLVIQLRGPHLDALIEAAPKSFAEEVGKRAADGLLAVPGIIATFLFRRPRARIRVEDETGATRLTLDRDSAADGDADAADTDTQARGDRSPRNRRD